MKNKTDIIETPKDINEKLIREYMEECRSNAKKHLDTLCMSQKLAFDDGDKGMLRGTRFRDVKIWFKNSKKLDWEGMFISEWDTKHSRSLLSLHINKWEFIGKEYGKLFSTVAHEMAHYCDYVSCRKSHHDLMFVHIWSVLSDFTIDVNDEASVYMRPTRVARRENFIDYKKVCYNEFEDE